MKRFLRFDILRTIFLAILSVTLLAACDPVVEDELACGGSGAFATTGPKESFSVTVQPTDQPGFYTGEINKERYGTVYRGPMRTYSPVPCDPNVGWGEIRIITQSTIGFSNGLTLIGVQAIDTIRSNGTELIELEEPNPRPTGILAESQWIGSAAGHEAYVWVQEKGTVFSVVKQEDFRLRFGHGPRDRIVAPEFIRSSEPENYTLIPNALRNGENQSPDSIDISTFIYPGILVTGAGDLLLPSDPLKVRCEQPRANGKMFLFGIQIDPSVCIGL